MQVMQSSLLTPLYNMQDVALLAADSRSARVFMFLQKEEIEVATEATTEVGSEAEEELLKVDL